MKITSLTDLSDLVVNSIDVVNGMCTINITDWDENDWKVKISTDVLYINSLCFEGDVVRRSGVRAVIKNLKEELDIRSGLYWPASEISYISRHVRSGISLAYGRRASDYNRSFCLVGSVLIFACLIKDDSQVEI